MDPLKASHEHVHDLILQHFSVDELLEFSKISKKWYNTIGKSGAAMEKIWLNVGDRFNEPTKEDLKAFRASERSYQNFKISEIENGLQILLFPKRCWRRSQMDIQSFINFKDFINLLKIFNETIVELEIFDMDIEQIDCDHEATEFSLLEKLRIGFVNSIAFRPFVRRLPKMKKLIIEDVTDLGVNANEDSAKMLTTILKLQPQLTHLSLSSNAFCKVFESEENYEMKLEHLLVDYSGNGESDESKKLLVNFAKFLATQTAPRSITLCEWTCVDILKDLFNQSSVERISFDYFDGDSKQVDTAGLKLNQNLNISQLDFDCETLSLKWLQPILEAAPNIRTLYLFHVTQELLEWLTMNLKQLRTLKYCSIYADFARINCLFKANRNLTVVEEKFTNLKEI